MEIVTDINTILHHTVAAGVDRLTVANGSVWTRMMIPEWFFPEPSGLVGLDRWLESSAGEFSIAQSKFRYQDRHVLVESCTILYTSISD